MDNYRLIQATNRSVWDMLRHALLGVGLLGAGLLIGAGTMPPSQAWGEVRVEPPPKSFETGGQMSIPVLKDIAATLHQMDARLARMETVAAQVQAQLLMDQRSQ